MAELTAGIKVHVFVPSEDEGTVELVSRLEGFGENKRFIITAPMLGAETYRLPVAREVHMQCRLASAIIDFDAVVRQRIEKGPLSFLLLEQTGEFKKTQRRQDFRIDCMSDGKLEYVSPVDGVSKRIKIVISDISGGGASVRCPVGFDLGYKVSLHIPLGGDSMQCYICEVRRCSESKDSADALKYNVGLKFNFRDKREKEDLVSRVFKMEREKKR